MPARTLRRLLIVATVALALPAATACDSYKDDVAAVQAADSIVPGKSNDSLAREIAGARGSVKWTGAKAERYDNEAIVLVTADIERVGQSGADHKIALEFINNRETRKIAFEQAFIDGKPQSLLGGALTLFLLQLD
ncbi:MAG: hypothetical protein IPK59_12550 [Rhodospirillaceae bacterium]|nr:hypothetical protein [Rhodospirillaceae bacterium]